MERSLTCINYPPSSAWRWRANFYLPPMGATGHQISSLQKLQQTAASGHDSSAGSTPLFRQGWQPQSDARHGVDNGILSILQRTLAVIGRRLPWRLPGQLGVRIVSLWKPIDRIVFLFTSRNFSMNSSTTSSLHISSW